MTNSPNTFALVSVVLEIVLLLVIIIGITSFIINVAIMVIRDIREYYNDERDKDND